MRILEKGRVEVIPSNEQVTIFYCQGLDCNRFYFKTIFTLDELSEAFYLAVSFSTDESLIKQLKARLPKLELPV